MIGCGQIDRGHRLGQRAAFDTLEVQEPQETAQDRGQLGGSELGRVDAVAGEEAAHVGCTHLGQAEAAFGGEVREQASTGLIPGDDRVGQTPLVDQEAPVPLEKHLGWARRTAA